MSAAASRPKRSPQNHLPYSACPALSGHTQRTLRLELRLLKIRVSCRRSTRVSQGEVAGRPEGRHQLRHEDGEVVWSRRLLLDDEWPTRQSGVGPDRLG